jgi:hypothetical protein
LEKLESPTKESVMHAKEILECEKYTGWKNWFSHWVYSVFLI